MSEIERYLDAFGPIGGGGGVSQLLSDSSECSNFDFVYAHEQRGGDQLCRVQLDMPLPLLS